MDTSKFAVLTKRTGKFLARKSPVILTGIGIAGMVTSTILAVKATPKALALIDIQKEREAEGLEEPLTNAGVVKLTWKCYIPSAAMGAVSIACLIGANTVNGKQKAALATAYTLSETALRTYKDKVVELIGEEKAKEVQTAVAQEQVNRLPAKDKEVIITAKGDYLCLEPTSGRYFKSDIESIKRDINELNRQMQTTLYITLNDLYAQLGLKPVDGNVGETMGWCIDTGLIDISFDACVADDGSPCLVIDYISSPRYIQGY
jgi:hypothetical protein